MRTPDLGAPGAHEHLGFRTTCGRDIQVGRLALGGAERPAQRVSVDIGAAPGRVDGTWAALTPAEARQLAVALLRQAAAADRPDADGSTGEVEARYLGGESYAVATRGHVTVTDQPASAGGQDAAMTPTELLAGSLTACVAYYAGRYLARHGLDRGGLRVTGRFTMAERPARVGGVKLVIEVPGGLPPARQDALLAVASHCTVHNTLRDAPDVTIELA